MQTKAGEIGIATTARRIFAFAGLVAVLGSCADGPTATIHESVASARGGEATTPFRGRARGQDVSIAFEAAGIRIVADAVGNATGVGSFRERLDYVLAYDLVNFAGGATLTAADGAQLFIEFVGTIPGFELQIFPLPYSAAYTIVGGTGRLAASSGAGTLSGIDFGAGAFAFTFDGTLTRAP